MGYFLEGVITLMTLAKTGSLILRQKATLRQASCASCSKITFAMWSTRKQPFNMLSTLMRMRMLLAFYRHFGSFWLAR